MVQGDPGGGGGPILRKSNFLEHLGKSKSSLNFKRSSFNISPKTSVKNLPVHLMVFFCGNFEKRLTGI